MRCYKKDCPTETQIMNWSLGQPTLSSTRKQLRNCPQCQARLAHLESGLVGENEYVHSQRAYGGAILPNGIPKARMQCN